MGRGSSSWALSPQRYLDDPAVHGHRGADHVHVWGGCGALSLGQRALRGRVGWVESEGMRCGIPVLGAEKERDTKGELWLFIFPLWQVKNTVQSNLSKSNIHKMPSREKAGIYTSTQLFGQLNHAQINLRNKFAKLEDLVSSHLVSVFLLLEVSPQLTSIPIKSHLTHWQNTGSEMNSGLWI